MQNTNLKLNLILPAIMACAFFALAGEASAATRVISASGTSTNDCTASSPCNWAKAYGSSANGDVIQVRSTGGAYKNQQWNIAKSITVEAYGYGTANQEIPLVDGEEKFPVPDDIGVRYDWLIQLSAANVKLRGIHVARSTGRGISVSADADGGEIIGGSVRDCWWHGINVSGVPADPVSNFTIDGSSVYRNVRWVLYRAAPDLCPTIVPGYFEVASGTNVLNFKYDGGATQSITIPAGKYTGAAISSALKSALNSRFSISSAVSWNASTAKLSISAPSGHTIQYIDSGSTLGDKIGFTADSAAAQTILGDSECGWWGTTSGTNNIATPAQLSLVNSSFAVIKNSEVYESYHEGLGLYKYANDSLVENSKIFGNGKTQIYVSNSHRCTLRNNLIYGTNSWVTVDSKPWDARAYAAIWLGGEDLEVGDYFNSDFGHRIYNNYIANSHISAHLGGYKIEAGCPAADDSPIGTECGVKDSRWHGNVFVEAGERKEAEGVGLNVTEAVRTGNILRNNAWLQVGGDTDSIVPAANRITIDHNLWYRTPSASARGTGDNYPASAYTLNRTGTWDSITSGSLNKTHFNFTGEVALYQGEGIWLTQTNGANAGDATIVVDDATWFYGDERIKFADGQNRNISSISGNAITLSSGVTVADNVGIGLYSNTPGSVPNIGPWDTQAPASPGGLAVR